VLGPKRISLIIILLVLAFSAFSRFFCSYKNFLYSKILQTGGEAFGEISTRSNPISLANDKAFAT
tara:strand:- start:1738 stop:1932 length:195 start_codon:yes stop_codon:yes gene_type:complete